MWVGLAFAGPQTENWGAIAVGPPMKSGWARDHPTKESAHRAALDACAHRDCQVELQIVGERCGSVAEGQGGTIAWAYGPEEEETRAWALKRCSRHDAGCRTLETVCNVRVSDWGHRVRNAGSSPGRPPARPPVRPRPGITPPPQVDPAVIDVCDTSFSGDANEDQCVAIMRGCQFDPVGTIRACEEAFDGDPNELECLRVAATGYVPLAPGIRACEEAFDGDTNELECLRIIAQSNVDATPYIEQCERTKDGDSNELACVKTSLGIP